MTALPADPLVARSAHDRLCPSRYRENSFTDCTCGLACLVCEKTLRDAFLYMVVDENGQDAAVCDDCWERIE